MDPVIIIALSPFYVCAVCIAAAIAAATAKGIVAMFGNAQELQDTVSK